jgi:hypothetical protein
MGDINSPFYTNGSITQILNTNKVFKKQTISKVIVIKC